MPKNLHVPAVVHHRATDQDCVCIRDAEGKRRMVYLGKHDSPEAARRYREVLAQHFAGKPVATATASRHQPAASEWPSVNQLCAAFVVYADRFYVDADGKQTRAVAGFDLALDPLLNLFRDVPTDRFTVADLCNVRQAMVDSGTLCRATINARLGRIKHVFRWGTVQRMVPGSVWHELSAMRGLPIGRAGVRESKVIDAVPWPMVEKVLPHLPSVLAAAMMLQWHTGMRPAEALAMRAGDIERSGPVWVYRPQHHKCAWRGRDRIVMLGPEAQAILRPLLKADPAAYLLSPRDSLDEQHNERRAARRTPPTKQMRERDAARARKEPPVGERYDVAAYRRAIHRACDLAKLPRWSPHRLRHAAGTRLVLQKGIEAAKAVLGHSDVKVTQRYAIGAESVLAIETMKELG